MRQAAAKQGDRILATDTHIVLVPGPSGSVPTPLPHPFTGIIDGNLSNNVNITKKPAATVGSTASNRPAHVVSAPGQSFQNPPTNKGTITQGSQTVRINGQAAARNGDIAETCNDPTPLPVGKVTAVGTVYIG